MDDEAEVENALVALLDFDKFDLIKELLRNRLKIVWCTRRERAQSEDERARIEVRLERISYQSAAFKLLALS